MNNLNLNKIDIKYAMSNNFNIDHLPKNENGDLLYGYKTIAICNFIIGLHKSAFKNCDKRKQEHHKYFWTKNKYIMITKKEIVVKYRVIAEKMKCSESLVKKVVEKLQELKVLVHYRFLSNGKTTNTWIFKFFADEFAFLYRQFRKICPDRNYSFVPHNDKRKMDYILNEVQEKNELEKAKIIERGKIIELAAKCKMWDMTWEQGKYWDQWFNNLSPTELKEWKNKINYN